MCRMRPQCTGNGTIKPRARFGGQSFAGHAFGDTLVIEFRSTGITTYLE